MRRPPLRALVAGLAGTGLLTAALLGSVAAQGPRNVYLPQLAVAVPTATPTATATAQPTGTATATPEPTAAPPTPTATTVPLPAEVLVQSSRSFVRSSFRYVVGELLNNTGSSVRAGTTINARFYNEAGQLVATEDGYALLDRIEPGQRVPFRVLLTNPPADISRYELSVNPRFTEILRYRAVTVVSQQTRDNFGPEVFGELRNDSGTALRNVEAAVTFYDAAGAVVDVGSIYASPLDLAPGATATYSIKTFDRGLSFASYQVQAEGWFSP